jgi:hypothetical protein
MGKIMCVVDCIGIFRVPIAPQMFKVDIVPSQPSHSPTAMLCTKLPIPVSDAPPYMQKEMNTKQKERQENHSSSRRVFEKPARVAETGNQAMSPKQ